MELKDFFTELLLKGLERFNRFYSCYRGTVVDNNDPNNQGRLQVKVPAITGIKNTPTWAYPKGMIRGKGYGMNFLPPMGSMVWVEFEYGDANFPIWTYGYNAKGEQAEEFNSSNMTLKTPEGNVVDLNDTDQAVSLKSKAGHLVVLDDKNNQIIITHKDGKKIVISNKDIKFNVGNNGGLINITALTNKINTLVTNYNALVSLFNTHQHLVNAIYLPPTPALPGFPSLTPTTPTGNPNALFVQSEYEDTDVIH